MPGEFCFFFFTKKFGKKENKPNFTLYYLTNTLTQ